MGRIRSGPRSGSGLGFPGEDRRTDSRWSYPTSVHGFGTQFWVVARNSVIVVRRQFLSVLLDHETGVAGALSDYVITAGYVPWLGSVK